MADYIPQVDYTSRDYSSIKDDMLSLVPVFAPKWAAADSTDFGVVLVELFAYMGDLLNYYIDRAANENFIQSATQEDTIRKIAKMYGYTPYGIAPASATVVFENTGSTTVVIPDGTLLSAGVDDASNTIYFETVGDTSISASSTASASVIQSKTYYNETIGTSNGAVNQYFSLANQNVDLTSITISVSNKVYTQVDNLLYYGATDKVFYAETASDNVTRIYFGDGVSGAIPANGSTVVASYKTCVGSNGNVIANAITTIETAGFDGVRIKSSTAATNGSDIESIDSIRINAPLFLRSGNRAVSMVDYQNLALNVSGVAKARAVSQYFTQVIIFVMSDNWSTTSSTVRQNVVTALTNKVPPSTTLQIVGGTISYPRFKVTVNALPTYSNTVVTAAVKSKLQELFAFSNVSFGQRITKSLIYSYINRSSVEGLDYITLDALDKSNVAPTTAGTAPTATDDLYLAANEIPKLDPLNIFITSGGTGL